MSLQFKEDLFKAKVCVRRALLLCKKISRVLAQCGYNRVVDNNIGYEEMVVDCTISYNAVRFC